MAITLEGYLCSRSLECLLGTKAMWVELIASCVYAALVLISCGDSPICIRSQRKCSSWGAALAFCFTKKLFFKICLFIFNWDGSHQQSWFHNLMVLYIAGLRPSPPLRLSLPALGSLWFFTPVYLSQHFSMIKKNQNNLLTLWTNKYCLSLSHGLDLSLRVEAVPCPNRRQARNVFCSANP